VRFPFLSLILLAAAAPLAAQAFDPEARLKELGITLPTPDKPVANYVKAVRTGNLVFLAGHGPCGDFNRPEIQGRVPSQKSIEQGYEIARLTAICLLASLKEEVGDLRKVRRVVKVLGMVLSDQGFELQPRVINGASDLFVKVFGERGKHARSAVGMFALPFNITVEIEMIVEVDPS
jgi:enamine deaminase RidA (YjgF/YER057c/UK114 family)